jgi:hypothetical protein
MPSREIPFCYNCKGSGHFTFECFKKEINRTFSKKITYGFENTKNYPLYPLQSGDTLHEEIIELDPLSVDTRTCAFQGEPERFGILKRTPCTYGQPDDGDNPSMAFDATKVSDQPRKPDFLNEYKKIDLNLTPREKQQAPQRIRTCLATWLPEMAQRCSKFQPREEEK